MGRTAVKVILCMFCSWLECSIYIGHIQAWRWSGNWYWHWSHPICIHSQVMLVGHMSWCDVSWCCQSECATHLQVSVTGAKQIHKHEIEESVLLLDLSWNGSFWMVSESAVKHRAAGETAEIFNYCMARPDQTGLLQMVETANADFIEYNIYLTRGWDFKTVRVNVMVLIQVFIPWTI